MDPNQTTQHAPEEFRSLMQDDRAYSSSPTWRVSVQPRATIIGVRSVWTLGTVHSFLFTGLGFGLYFARAWFDLSEDVGQFLAIAAWVCWSLAGLFLFGVIGVQICRSKEDWFVCRPLEQTVSCPRLDKEFGIDDVVGLQFITGWIKGRDVEGPKKTKLAQLNLIVKEGGQLQRYGLIGDLLATRLAKQAQLLAEHCGIPLMTDEAPTADS